MTRIARIALWLAVVSAIGCRQQTRETTKRDQTQRPATQQPSPQPAAPEAVKLKVLPPGVHQQTIQREDGIVFRYTISIPQSYSSQKPSPLIVALHYGGEVTPFYGRGMVDIVGRALKELNAIIVAPDAISGDWTSPINESAVIQLIDSVNASYNVDKSKTLLTGYSMGGSGTWHIAGRHQDRFAAAIPIAGLPIDDTEWTLPVYAIHARQDRVIPLKPTQQRMETLKAQGLDAKLVILEGVTHYETARFIDPLRAAIPWIKRIWQ